MTWIAPTPATPLDGPLVGPDRPILEGFLRWERQTLMNICSGLTDEQLASRPLPSSNLSLLGLVRHMAKVERIWFRQRAGNENVADMYDQSVDRDTDFNALDASHAEADFTRYEDECLLADKAAADVSFDAEFIVKGETLSLRLIYVHMIAEYARHNGHADLLREAIDGTSGR